MNFTKAVKHESKLRLAIAGPSGSGKTYSALRIGTALGRTAVIDTESGSASKYADVFEFDVLEMEAPFSPAKYIAAIQAAGDAGYDVVVVDSLTHAWNGTGGVLDIVDQAAKQIKGNSYMAWKSGTPHQNALIEAIVTAKLHVIGTMRSKTEYALTTNERGKVQPQKVGMSPIQRDGFEYEFDVMFDMDIENNAIVTKTRCSALNGVVINQPGEDVANILKQWLSGAPPLHWTENPPASPAAARDRIMANVPRYSDNSHAAVNVVKKFLDGRNYADLTKAERITLMQDVEAHATERDKQDAADAVSVETPLSKLIAADAVSAE